MAARYQEYEKELKTAGIHILHNESCSLQVGKTSLTVYGLEVPLILSLIHICFDFAHFQPEFLY